MRVLLPIDGSESARIGIELARRINWPDGSHIRLLSVVSPSPEMTLNWAPDVQDEIVRQTTALTAAADSELEYAAQLLARSGAQISRAVVRGRPASAIVDEAEALPADLVLLGGRGHGVIATMLFGSVSAEVVDHAPCPVLVARNSRISRVVLGYDGSEYARAAEKVVARWPIFAAAGVDVVAVASPGIPYTSGLGLSMNAVIVEEFAESARALLDESSQIAGDAADRLQRLGRHARSRAVEGDPATQLLDIAQALEADLIVVGTRGRTGLSRLVLGSVARNVLNHALCSVLVVRQSTGAHSAARRAAEAPEGMARIAPHPRAPVCWGITRGASVRSDAV